MYEHENGWRVFEAKGRILRLPSGLIVVLFEQKHISWNAVIVEVNQTYPRGGYNIVVPNEDILVSEEIIVT